MLCIYSYIFLLFDMYVIQYNDIKSTTFLNNIQNDLINNNLNLNQIIVNNNAYIYKDIVNNLTTDIFKYDLSLCYHKYKILEINKNLSPINLDNDTKTVIIFYVKKFDNTNYICPLMTTLNEKIINDFNKKLVFYKQLKEIDERINSNLLLQNFHI